MLRYKLCIVAGGGFCIAIWLRYKLRHGHGAPRYDAWGYNTRDSARHDAHAWPWCWVCRDTTCDMAGQACDTAGLGHDTAGHGLRHAALCATIQFSARHDTEPCALPGRSACGLCTQAVFRVCTWCTQPSFGFSALFLSHYLGHCS